MSARRVRTRASARVREAATLGGLLVGFGLAALVDWLWIPGGLL